MRILIVLILLSKLKNLKIKKNENIILHIRNRINRDRISDWVCIAFNEDLKKSD